MHFVLTSLKHQTQTKVISVIAAEVWAPGEFEICCRNFELFMIILDLRSELRVASFYKPGLIVAKWNSDTKTEPSFALRY